MKDMFKTRKQRKGFSLVELVVVILIIAILAVAVFAGGSAVIKKSQVSRTTSDLHNFSVAVEAFLNETPSVANMSSYKDMSDKKVLDSLNAGLAEDYKLSLLTGAETGGNITTKNGAPSDTDKYFIAKSAKTDAWDNPYYVVFDTVDRNGSGKSDFFITVISAGPDAKTVVDGAIGGANATKADDVFLLVQYTDGDVTAVTYNAATDDMQCNNMKDGSNDSTNKVELTALAKGTATYIGGTTPGNAPVNFK